MVRPMPLASSSRMRLRLSNHFPPASVSLPKASAAHPFSAGNCEHGCSFLRHPFREPDFFALGAFQHPSEQNANPHLFPAIPAELGRNSLG